MRQRIPIEQYAGNVAVMAAAAVMAGYRPANAYGALQFMPAPTFGLAFYSALAVMEDRSKAVDGRLDHLIKDAESRTDPADALAALNASADERAALIAERDQLEAQMRDERKRRDSARAAPSGTSEAEILDKTAAAAELKPPTPFASLGEQLQAVRAAAIAQKSGRPIDSRLTAIQEYHEKIQAATGASEIVGADGGFLVQTDLSNELMDEIIPAATFAPRAKTREIGAGFNGVKFNVIDETSRATGSRYGGVRWYWVGEGGQKTASRPKLRQIEISLAKGAAMYVATDELLQDAVGLESFVRPAFVEEGAFFLDDAMFRGTGVGQPLGVLNSDALVTVSKVTGQDADTVILENIDGMLVRMLPSSLPRSAFFINQELWPQIFGLHQVIGVGGVPVYLPPGSGSDSPFGSLRGRPVVVTEYNSAPGDLGDILLADWSQYMLVRKGGIQQASSIHVYFDTDETAFRWVMRVNGRPIRDRSLTPYKGTGTLSPFVTLQAR